MSVTFETDLREFSRTLDKYLTLTSKELSAAVNHQAGRLAFSAIQNTKKADRKEIEKLGVVGYRIIKSRKTGTIRQGRPIYNEHGRARDIVAARYYKRGEKLPDDIDKQAQNLIAARLRAISFVRSGWLAAIRAFKAFGNAGLTPDARQRGRPKGKATRAREGFNPVATLTNSALPSKNAKQVCESGLQKAIRERIADMRVYIERKLKESARNTGITVK